MSRAGISRNSPASLGCRMHERSAPTLAMIAAMSGPGTGAIASILIFGEAALGLLADIFKPAAALRRLKEGRIAVGTIKDGARVLDSVVVCRESPRCLAINCHGNPLIVAEIMGLLARLGAEVVGADRMNSVMAAEAGGGAIAAEAAVKLRSVRSLAGSAAVLAQCRGGLAGLAESWAERLKAGTPLDSVRREAAAVIERSRAAGLFINGCRLTLTGPSNTGKSTLLNRLAGRNKALVSPWTGTTRDWVSADCRIGELPVEIIDTAGLDDGPPGDCDWLQLESRRRAVGQLAASDLILLVLAPDVRYPQPDEIAAAVGDLPMITVLNKSDIYPQVSPPALFADQPLRISAKTGANIELLRERILKALGTGLFDPAAAICFTQRQSGLVEAIANCRDNAQAAHLASRLLEESLDV